MQTEIKEKWVKALRSGEYEQCRYTLYTRDKRYCCLGVLAKLVGVIEDHSALIEKSGITKEQRDSCVDLNDHRKKTFAEIADYVEANL